MDKIDFTLLALAFANGKNLSPVQLQKTVFLFEKLLPSNVLPQLYYEFIPYNYGPFCNEVYTDATLLEAEGLAKIEYSPVKSYREYSATSEGLSRGLELRNQLPPSVCEYAHQLVGWVLEQSFTGLVSAIYQQFPEYRVNSIFRS